MKLAKILVIFLLLLFPLIGLSQGTTVIKGRKSTYDSSYIKRLLYISPGAFLPVVSPDSFMIIKDGRISAKLISDLVVSSAFEGGVVSKVPYVGEDITSTTVIDWIQKAFYPFVEATISLGTSVLKEVGTSTFCSLTPSITAHSETIFTLGRIDKIYPSTVNINVWGSGAPASTTYNFVPISGDATSYSLSFRAYETVGGNGTPTEINSSGTPVTFNACYPYLYGMSTTDFSANGPGLYADVSEITKIVQLCTTTVTVTFSNSNDLRYAYFAYPSSGCTILSKIYDPNGFDVTDTFDYTTITVNSTGLTNDWSNITYYVYRSKVPFTTPAPNTYPFTFVR
jgi:hypothetical protein